MTHHTLRRRGPDPRPTTTVDRRRPRASTSRPARSPYRRRQRVRQVHAAARPGPAAQAGAARCCSTASGSTSCPPRTSPPGSASCRSSRSRPRASPSPTSSPAAATRTSAGSASGRATTRPPSPRPCGPPAIADLADRPVDELSGGQRQRAWIAMALAQGTDLCCSTSRRRSSTSPTRSRCSTCSPTSTASEGRTIVLRAARPQPGLPLRPPPGRDEGRRDRRAGPPAEVITQEMVPTCSGCLPGHRRPPHRARRSCSPSRHCQIPA